MTASNTALSDILITDELQRRPRRLANIQKELSALREISRHVEQRSTTLVSMLCELAASMCEAGSAGISIVHNAGNEEFFGWDVVAGKAASFAGGKVPRHDSPCGICLKFKEPQLFRQPGRYFNWLNIVSIPVAEALVIPLYLSNAKPLGTIWILSHEEERNFDKEDVRILRELGDYVIKAYSLQEQRPLAEAAR
ncbi:MAG: GAF domain-containing protein [Burkholderiales bacterium]|nr:GAF domain-containing protein [Burkholderiales bacterium]